jgi:hypothetical protein
MAAESQSPDMVAFQVFANELSDDEPNKTLSKIKRKLGRLKMPYHQSRVEHIASLHAALRDEVSKAGRSKYHAGTPGTFASPEHFATEDIVHDYAQAYPFISVDDLHRMVGFAIYYYYLR